MNDDNFILCRKAYQSLYKNTFIMWSVKTSVQCKLEERELTQESIVQSIMTIGAGDLGYLQTLRCFCITRFTTTLYILNIIFKKPFLKTGMLLKLYTL